MITIDINKYWSEIIKEQNDIELIKELNIRDLNSFLNKTERFI